MIERHAVPSRRTALRGLAALGLVVVAAGCSMSPRNRGEQLREAVFGYNDAVRWGRIERAAEWIPVTDRGGYIARKRAAWAGMAVHEIDVRHVDYNNDQSQARVRVLVTFSRTGNPVLQRHLVEQHWKWEREGWMCVARRQVALPQAAPGADPRDLY